MTQKKPEISKGIDWLVVWLYIILVSIGILSIFAATYREGDPILQSFLSFKTDYSRQLLFFGIGGVLAVFILLTDSKFFTATANLWYAFGMILLLLVFPFHTQVKGTQSIIRFGAFQLQPAELCKVFVNLALAKYLSRVETDFSKTRSQLIAAAIALAPAVISIMQHETGLALVYFSFFLVMFREGLPAGVLIIGFSLAVLVVATLLMEPNTLAIILTAVAALAIYLLRRQIKRRRRLLFLIMGIWFVCVGIQRFAVPYIFDNVLQPYQVKRIYDTIGKDYIPKDAREALEIEQTSGTKKKDDGDYNVKQSKIAIGSGGLSGKGLLKGTQTRYEFVPEQRTDFIFCTIGEGFGFIGSTVLMGIYFLLLMRIITIAERQRSVFSRCYAYGVASVMFFHIAINICMTVGLAPVIGIPLPFISYGGTALLTFTVLLFIMIRLDADRQMVLR
ncbi:rod shape-determining protein RodA [Flavihumibacter petaseus]|uniref:Cell wall polymerase n=1 Tax=Flavihumibacter petaseus NBRC 106054 TaxID=1220578 RepID=A0A0E9N6X5_9BACT|nr:rod shape-determining protein RodA [Flavihumibacter petaseus]GAO45100.1 putative rod shape-determining protein [Flavihumibacter petaseus NBRC 106054]